MGFTANIPTSKGVSFPIPVCVCSGSPVDGVVQEEDSPPDKIPARRLFDFKAVMHFIVRCDPNFLCGGWPLLWKTLAHINKLANKCKSKTPLIQFVEYSCEFLNSDASIVLMQPVVSIMRVLYSSGSASHHPDGPLSSKYSVTPCNHPFQKHQHRLLQKIVLLEKAEGLFGCKLAGTFVLLCLSSSLLWVAINFLFI